MATLDRVTQLAALVAHLSDEVNGLASQEEKLVSETEERLADLQRRVALAESPVSSTPLRKRRALIMRSTLRRNPVRTDRRSQAGL